MTSPADINRHVAQRRTVAIISHPDAGKTTLTEQLLAVTGAINLAGKVDGKRTARSTVTDWMQMERDRGISIASSAVRLVSEGVTINLLDTPGHGDFSEDTYRVLAAVDAAIMLLDASKGIEPQTRRLFEVCRARSLPIVTFVNKLDRPAMEPLELVDHVERELDLTVHPLTWPVADSVAFAGVVRTETGEHVEVPWEPKNLPEDAWERAEEEGALASDASGGMDVEAFHAGTLSPMLFGSAVRGFGLEDLLDVLRRFAPMPGPREDANGDQRPVTAPFAAQVFKLQANIDQRHRDVTAFMRVCSGHFERGQKATLARTSRPMVITRAVEPFGQDRATVDEAWPGDVLALPGANDLRIGDTLYSGSFASFPHIPTFAPHLFREASNRDSARRKQFQSGLQQLGDEGVVQIYTDPRVGMQRPICAAVGELQFEVFSHRMVNEFGVDLGLTQLPLAASVALPEGTDPDSLPRVMGMRILEHHSGQVLVAFENEWSLKRYREQNPELPLSDVL